MKISTVLATYNGEKYILEQIYSILNQTRKVDEVIIVDDGSNDNTVFILKKFIEEHSLQGAWKLYINEKNLGYKLNFKKALEYTSGDVVLLCDQDDVWEKDKVEELEIAFVNVDALAINASFRFIDSSSNFVNLKENNNNNNLLKRSYEKDELVKISLESIIANNISPGCTMAVRRELVDLFVETTSGIQPHDWELNILASLKGGLYFYNKKLTRYRIHDENEIGMTTDLNKTKLTPNLSYERRCHNISERLKLIELFEQLESFKLLSVSDKKLFEKLIAYDKLRYKCVVERKTYIWIYMLIYNVYILKYNYVGLRELIGDFVFSMKK